VFPYLASNATKLSLAARNPIERKILSMTSRKIGAFVYELAKRRHVIAVEQQAHCHTADIDRPLTYAQMADDTAELLRQLKIENADFFGYSMGGAIALELAVYHPELVGKLVWA